MASTMRAQTVPKTMNVCPWLTRASRSASVIAELKESGIYT